MTFRGFLRSLAQVNSSCNGRSSYALHDHENLFLLGPFYLLARRHVTCREATHIRGGPWLSESKDCLALLVSLS